MIALFGPIFIIYAVFWVIVQTLALILWSLWMSFILIRALWRHISWRVRDARRRRAIRA